MLRNLIFDFGGVLINLDMEAVPRGLKKFGMDIPDPGLVQLGLQYEIGLLSTEGFLNQAQGFLSGSSTEAIRDIWNQTIADFPIYRLEYLEELRKSGHYRMYLLSNTNALHIEEAEKSMGRETYLRFRNCFHGFYLSHEIGMRKPEPEIFEFVLNENRLNAEETLFIDDTKEHIESASRLGIRTWHLRVGQEDILELNNRLY